MGILPGFFCNTKCPSVCFQFLREIQRGWVGTASPGALQWQAGSSISACPISAWRWLQKHSLSQENNLAVSINSGSISWASLPYEPLFRALGPLILGNCHFSLASWANMRQVRNKIDSLIDLAVRPCNTLHKECIGRCQDLACLCQ